MGPNWQCRTPKKFDHVSRYRWILAIFCKITSKTPESCYGCEYNHNETKHGKAVSMLYRGGI